MAIDVPINIDFIRFYVTSQADIVYAYKQKNDLTLTGALKLNGV